MSNIATLKKGGITTEIAAKMGKRGGEASGKAKKEKKLMSAILADYLARQKGFDSFDQYINKVLKRGDGSTVSMIKTFADVIEGSKLKTETTVNINTDDETVKNILAEYGISKPKD
jgi:hypothetical protein